MSTVLTSSLPSHSRPPTPPMPLCPLKLMTSSPLIIIPKCRRGLHKSLQDAAKAVYVIKLVILNSYT